MFVRCRFFIAVAATVIVFDITNCPASEPASHGELLNSVESQWHQWRGPYGTGEAAADAVPPLKWDDRTNIRWVAELPGEGSSTPVVWGDQIFVLSAESSDRKAANPPARDAQAKTDPPDNYYRFMVTCVDRNSGAVQWQKLAVEQVPHEGHHQTHTYAGGSPTTDGERLYASFGSRGIFCYTMDGDLLWQKDLGDMTTRFGWGEAVTPALTGELLIVNWDQESGSFITALDAKTGDERWRRERPDEATSWNTPFITEFGGRTLAIVNGTSRARAYDVESGDVVWECGGQTVNAIPSPVRFDDFVVCMSGFKGAASFAIPLASSGDVTNSPSLLWQHDRGTPYVPSPTLSGHRLYFTGSNSDVMSCLDVQTGKPIAEQKRLNRVGELYASPLAANGHVYFLGRQGTTVIVQDSDSTPIVATNSISDAFDASPVAVGKQLFLRSWTKLYCVEE